jgi:hypothetical protein
MNGSSGEGLHGDLLRTYTLIMPSLPDGDYLIDVVLFQPVSVP